MIASLAVAACGSGALHQPLFKVINLVKQAPSVRPSAAFSAKTIDQGEFASKDSVAPTDTSTGGHPAFRSASVTMGSRKGVEHL
jgi:hypothetical protein